MNKQQALKVVSNGYGVYFCPTCKGTVWQIKEESKYCFRCGQKLDWQDVK
jgi:rubrerythrin